MFASSIGRVQKKRKDRITRKSKSEEKVVGFSFGSLFHTPQGNGSHLPRVNTKGIENLPVRKTQGASIIKGWEDKLERRRIPDEFT